MVGGRWWMVDVLVLCGRDGSLLCERMDAFTRMRSLHVTISLMWLSFVGMDVRQMQFIE